MQPSASIQPIGYKNHLLNKAISFCHTAQYIYLKMRNHSVWTITGIETENIKYATAVYSESVNKTTKQMMFSEVSWRENLS